MIKAATNPVAAIAVPVDAVFSDASVLLAIPKLESVPGVTSFSISSTTEVVTGTGLTNSISLIDEVCTRAVVLLDGSGWSGIIGSCVVSLLIATQQQNDHSRHKETSAIGPGVRSQMIHDTWSTRLQINGVENKMARIYCLHGIVSFACTPLFRLVKWSENIHKLLPYCIFTKSIVLSPWSYWRVKQEMNGKKRAFCVCFFVFFVFYATNLEQNKKRSLTDCSEQGYIGQKWGTEVYYVIWSYWSQSEAAKSKRPTQKKRQVTEAYKRSPPTLYCLLLWKTKWRPADNMLFSKRSENFPPSRRHFADTPVWVTQKYIEIVFTILKNLIILMTTHDRSLKRFVRQNSYSRHDMLHTRTHTHKMFNFNK